jgi:uncharacterized protein YbjT (DUF2867 family)
MARALIVGCGCHGRELGGELRGRDWLVRGTSRGPDGVAAIAAAGLEGALADPDRPGTILELVGDITAVVWLLGSAVGAPLEVEAIHGPRLERLLEKLVDTPVRGFAYESAGDAPAAVLRGGAEIAARAAERWRIPVAMLDAPRGEPGWAETAADRIGGLLAPEGAG